ncbi:S-adenosyl-L-methionine-dependent methyltransferase [Zopfia rhizophila CBS 207.26]|uniref:S-adenosyl-L-methionine-dependent methyltransferase n=1 Tax=Zopfia rhizophila CBS 207.26 TaxID=1314779 RepID=A0A6A6EI13_9PEZI|nr:S-adenosyl-L-methionine-dependent methyltransferase [Zopfia rhizophila CBS 207.26]
MSLADANRKYFDTIGDAYDNKPWFAKVNQQVTDALRARLDWVGIPFVNTGSASSSNSEEGKIFGPYVTVTRGIDISPNMVATYNARARSAGLPASTIDAVVGDLFAPEQPKGLSGPEYFNFDLATVGFGFHHFEDVVHAARCLKQRLRPGGALVINDFLEGGDLKADEQGNPVEGSKGNHAMHRHHHHGHSQGHSHTRADDDPAYNVLEEMNTSIVVPSFTQEGVKKFFTEAGFVDVDVIIMEEKVYMEFAGNKIWRTILLAKGRRPLDDVEKLKSEL